MRCRLTVAPSLVNGVSFGCEEESSKVDPKAGTHNGALSFWIWEASLKSVHIIDMVNQQEALTASHCSIKSIPIFITFRERKHWGKQHYLE